ncbi:MAG TPA: hypothetical protein VLD37_04285 [Candidatus Bilamarchaeum sp.]|nr:hypothetical protein [Candidatus Bilamarchaeum sp.]
MRAILFLALLALAGVSFPALACISDATNVVLSQQGVNIGIVLMLTIFVIAAAYVAGSVLTNANYIVFAKDELYHLAFSVAFLAGFSGVLLMSCSIMDTFFDSLFTNLGTLPSGCYSGGSMQSTASCYITLVRGDATRLSESYIQHYLDELMDSTFSWSLQIPLLNTYTSTADSYKRVKSNQYDMILNSFLIPALMSVSMQKIMLEFISENVITWVMPSAFLLRVFIPTRQMGNILIALSLGLYIIVPFMYVFNFAMYDVVNNQADCQQFAPAVCDFVADSGCGNPIQTCDNLGSSDSFWNIGRLIPVAFFLPNLTIAILITFLGAIHKALRVVG